MNPRYHSTGGVQLALAIYDQINMEWYSAYFYLSIHSYYVDQELNGFGNWFYVQTQEERDHAMLFIHYLQQQGEAVALEAIDKPDKTYKAFIDPLKMSAEHERIVTDLIHKIYAAASKENDFRTMQFLDWFVKEQAEEEDNADDNVTKFELFGNDSKGLYDLDNEMKTRIYAAPSLVIG